MKSFWHKMKTPILALAPMAGITDSAFRQICRKYGADVVYSEMASVSALFYKPEKTLELLKFNSKERPYVVQLFGKNPEHFAKAAKIITEKIKPDGLDINFGCPAKKVFGHGSGCALMLDVKLSKKIITAVLQNTPLPVSIKIRAGVRNQNALDFIEKLKNLPFQTVMLHGRTYEGGFGGTVDYALATKIKKIIPKKIILLNGGITTPEQASDILKKYPLIDGLGIGRGALGRPWLFEEIKKLLNCHLERIRSHRRTEKSKDLIRLDSSTMLGMTNFKEVKKIILEHARLLYKNKPQAGAFEIRKHLAWYIRGFPGASEIRKQLVQTKSLKEIKKIL
jgi:nifR3 family TIM-barrel protein